MSSTLIPVNKDHLEYPHPCPGCHEELSAETKKKMVAHDRNSPSNRLHAIHEECLRTWCLNKGQFKIIACLECSQLLNVQNLTQLTRREQIANAVKKTVRAPFLILGILGILTATSVYISEPSISLKSVLLGTEFAIGTGVIITIVNAYEAKKLLWKRDIPPDREFYQGIYKLIQAAGALAAAGISSAIHWGANYALTQILKEDAPPSAWNVILIGGISTLAIQQLLTRFQRREEG